MHTEQLIDQLQGNFATLWGFKRCYDVVVVHPKEAITATPRTRNKDIVFVSGGLESSLIAATRAGTTTTTAFVHVPGIIRHCSDRNLGKIEPWLCQLGWTLGARSVCFSLEWGPLNPAKAPVSEQGQSLATLCEKLQLGLVSPLLWADKFTLFSMARDRNLRFSSCCTGDNENEAPLWNQWCGRCFKCWQLMAFELAIRELQGSPPYLDYHVGLDVVHKHIAEIEEYRQTGIDRWSGDNESLLIMERRCNVRLAHLPW